MIKMTPEQKEALNLFSKLSYEDMVKQFNDAVKQEK